MSKLQLPRSLSDLHLTARFLPFFPTAALPKYSRSPATLRFCRLALGKNHQKSPRSLKVRQTPRSLSDLRFSRLDFCPFSPGASLLPAPSEPPSFFVRFALSLSALFGSRVYDSHTSSKPPACFWCAAYVRFRRPPWRLFLAIARHSLRDASP